MEMREEELVLSTVLWRGLDLLFPQGNISCLIVEHIRNNKVEMYCYITDILLMFMYSFRHFSRIKMQNDSKQTKKLHINSLNYI